MSDTPLNNIALLIDADNASHAGIDPVLTVLAELGQVNIRRAYGNWKKPALAKWEQITHRYGLQPMQRVDEQHADQREIGREPGDLGLALGQGRQRLHPGSDGGFERRSAAPDE